MHDQDFTAAADFRDKEKFATDDFKKCLDIIMPGNNLAAAADYFLDNYPKLLETASVAAEGI